MGLHAYCVVPAGHAIPHDCAGLDSERTQAVAAGPLDVWVTEHAVPIPPSAEAARIHDAVVRAAMTQQVTPVPLRFGQWFAARAAAAEALAGDVARWQSLLERFAGRAEYGIRVLTMGQAAERDVHAAAMDSGREYMAALARKQASAADRRAIAERIDDAIRTRLAGLSVEERVEHSATGELLVSIAHLVAWPDVAAYHAALDDVRGAWADTRILQTGPWPPYSFVA